MDLTVFTPSSVYLENRQGGGFENEIPAGHERRGAFWSLIAQITRGVRARASESFSFVLKLIPSLLTLPS
jgi:hypothetical protein